MLPKKAKAVVASILTAAMATNMISAASVTASAAGTPNNKYGDATYAQRFMSMYNDVITNGQKL